MTETFDDDFLSALGRIDIGKSHDLDKLSWYNYITPEAVEQSLSGFDFPVQKNSRWLSLAFKELMFMYVGDAQYFLFEQTESSYPGKTKIRRELNLFSEKLAQTSQSISTLSPFSDSVLKRYSSITNDCVDLEKVSEEREIQARKAGIEATYGFTVADISQKAIELKRMLKEFENFTLDAMERLCAENEKPRWRNTERRSTTVTMAVHLAVIFEFVTGKKATVNNWQSGDGQENYGHWHDFFIRIACLLLKQNKIPDPVGILKDARKIRLGKNSKI